MGILLSEAAGAATDAAADAEAYGSFAGSIGSLILIWGAMFAVFYFFMIRPQGKEKKRIAAMLADLSVGDSIMTTSGFYGTVIDIVEDTVVVEFGSDRHCRIPMDKSAVSKVEKAGE